jgi:hypothetical protein
MGYIELSSGLGSFSKAVMSIWFRLPSDSVNASKAYYQSVRSEVGLTDGIMAGILPLVTWGPRGTVTPNDFYPATYGTEMARSYIGVRPSTRSSRQSILLLD